MCVPQCKSAVSGLDVPNFKSSVVGTTDHLIIVYLETTNGVHVSNHGNPAGDAGPTALSREIPYL